MRRLVAVAVTGCLALAVAPVRAEVQARPLIEALKSRSGGPLLEALSSGDEARLSFITEGSEMGEADQLLHVVGEYFVARGPADAFSDWALSSSPTRASWSAPLAMLLDQADGWTRSSSGRAATGLAGEGVYIGIVDSGVDAAHPDLRNPDGTTRIAWLIDFARDPVGLHPALEERYGCNSERFPCRVLAASDIDELLFNSVRGDEPLDRFGHGTHVASLAAGNGLSDAQPSYVGMAPSASLVIAQAAGPGGVIDEANVLLSTSFVFERARDDGVPSVVNISLGTDFGAHDGSSSFEQALASFVGPDEPGRAIVVAAGNSAIQERGLTTGYPEPLGAHTEVRVNEGVATKVPLLTIARAEPTRADVFVWLRTMPGDDLALRFDNGAGRHSPRVEPGTTRAMESSDWGDPDDYEVLIVNSPPVADDEFDVGAGSAAIVVSGTWASGRSFGIVLEGEGNASLWVEANRDLTRTSSSGAFFPRSSKQGTITVPATHPELLAVGATLNREDWVDSEGNRIVAAELSRFSQIELDAVGSFSSAGPTATGVFKPELVAPGINVIGALSEDADPREGARSLFASGGACPSSSECLVVSEHHAVTTGTSMSAPLVAGAIALLMQREPRLDAARARYYLMAGSRALRSNGGEQQQQGVGALDVVGALTAQDLGAGVEAGSAPPSAKESRFLLADTFAYPDPGRPFEAWLLLRDEAGALSDPDAGQLTLQADPVRDATLRRMAPSLWKVSALPEASSGGEDLVVRVLVGGRIVAQRRVPIAVDRHAAYAGFSARGGCALRSPAKSRRAWLPWLFAWACWVRSRRSRHRTVK